MVKTRSQRSLAATELSQPDLSAADQPTRRRSSRIARLVPPQSPIGAAEQLETAQTVSLILSPTSPTTPAAHGFHPQAAPRRSSVRPITPPNTSAKELADREEIANLPTLTVTRRLPSFTKTPGNKGKVRVRVRVLVYQVIVQSIGSL